jgi:DNA-binding PadR family transcriptional regulator
MTKISAERGATALEATVLGMVSLRQPCTVYEVMRELEDSESSFHRSRAGSAYSVANRLIKDGYLRLAKEGSTSGRREIVLSESGRERLQDWLAPPVPVADVAFTVDLIRLRCFFLGALPSGVRRQFVDESIQRLKEFGERCEALVRANQDIGDYFGVLAASATVLETEARLQWLRAIMDLVDAEPGDQSGWADAVLARLRAPADKT